MSSRERFHRPARVSLIAGAIMALAMTGASAATITTDLATGTNNGGGGGGGLLFGTGGAGGAGGLGGSGGTLPITSVPEPPGLSVFGTSLLGLLLYRRVRRRPASAAQVAPHRT